MPKLRISFSLLSSWMEGDTDRAVATYFHVNRPKSKAMTEGGDIHDKIAKYIEENKKLPPYMPQLPLNNPKSEVYHKVSYNEMFDLSAKFDLEDLPIIGEWKTGVSDCLEWSRTIQIPFYFLIAELAGLEVGKAYLAHFNQHNRTNDWLVEWNNKTAIDSARNIIDSVGPEIYGFFEEQGLL